MLESACWNPRKGVETRRGQCCWSPVCRSACWKPRKGVETCVSATIRCTKLSACWNPRKGVEIRLESQVLNGSLSSGIKMIECL